MENSNDKFVNQLKKGLFELCILLILKKKDTYGYEINKRLNDLPLFGVSEGAIYPVLKRLVSYDYVNTYWVENEVGPARKYYSITKLGESLIDERMETFQLLFHSVSILKKECES
ncbi:PadR family transcriptional regulator [Bacillus sp. AFS002410]|uniref:PadR family transcriptional regulator n=1 Tax=Bacillus sp. AFS002410 TaxID=2033481 RepID=UPI000BF02251|nr:PadR family transcriptional regulator [Bacillus sp. AFS002410]PEJ59071.1 PadR family transcriptional regulator [Bacillus sp. AFS002410]